MDEGLAFCERSSLAKLAKIRLSGNQTNTKVDSNDITNTMLLDLRITNYRIEAISTALFTFTSYMKLLKASDKTSRKTISWPK